MSSRRISPKMKRAIDLIQEVTKIKYTGKSFEEAQKFIEENIEKIKDVDIREYREPSEKMWKGISFICRTLGMEFEGSTMKDASDFIKENMNRAIQVSEENKK